MSRSLPLLAWVLGLALLFISHDVHFIRNLAETTVHVSGGKLTKYSGGYDYFLEKSGLNDDRSAVTA